MTNPMQRVLEYTRRVKEQMEPELARGGWSVTRELGDRVFFVDPVCEEVVARTVPVNTDGVRGEWVLADGHDPDSRLLYLHGGGYVVGSPAGHRPLVSRIAVATGCAILSLDYRLAPENPYPAGLDDCVHGYQWLLRNGPKGVREAKSIFISGDSSGGALTLTTALRIRDGGMRNPTAIVPLSPGTDYTLSSASMESCKSSDTMNSKEMRAGVRALYLRHGEDLEDPYISPLYAEMAGLPPVYIQTGGLEVMRDDAIRFVEKARTAGVDATIDVFDGMPHVFQGFAPLLPEAQIAIDRIGAFVRRHRED